VSAAAAPASAPAGRISRPGIRLIYWGMLVICLLILGKGLASDSGEVSRDFMTLVPWFAVIGLFNLLPVAGWQSTSFTADDPLVLAAALLLTPLETGLVTFVGALNLKEFRGQISIEKTLFNRSQLSVGNYLGSLVVHMLARSPARSPFIVPLAFLALATTTIFNYSLVGIAVSLERGYPITRVIRRLQLGTFSDFVLTFSSWTVLGAMLAALYDQSHPWALLAFAAPAFLARQALVRSQMFLDTSRAHRSREHAVTELSHKIHEERTDERRLIAADLHDEVMQPLYKVTLMAHVLKADLATGRLLDIDSDLPELILAAENASNSLRELIGDLRRSPLGRNGLSNALERLVQSIEGRSLSQVERRIEPVVVEAGKELVVYQIAKEALSNALSHSSAPHISVELRTEDDTIVLAVRDDGIGFDPVTEREGHFGLQIMKERANSIGGDLFLDSAPSHGSSVILVLRPALPTS
jgi:signal transduction histidine kinase